MPTQPLTLSLNLEQQSNNAVYGKETEVTVDWSMDPPGKLPLVVPASAASASAARSTQVQLVIPREVLPDAAVVTVSVKLSIPGQPGVGKASLPVPLSASPVLKSPLEVELLGKDRSFGRAAFRLSAAGIVHDSELT